MKYVLVFIVFLPFVSNGQDHNVYTTAGSFFGAFNVINVNYEYKNSNTKSKRGPYLKVSAGHAWFVDIFFGEEVEEGVLLSTELIYLFGKKKSNFELGIGLSYNNVIENEIAFRPALALGYRHQSESRIFRTGIGYLEGIYFSYGFRF